MTRIPRINTQTPVNGEKTLVAPPPAGNVPSAANSTPIRPIRGLDGIRALAALAVLAYHLLPGSLVGGFLGVDVFFVLSGFLITSLLISEKNRYGKINLRKFWVRRVRRLFPAAFLMAIATVIIAGLFSLDLLAGIVPQFFGVVTFSYNWVEIYKGVSYFNAASPHLWTNVWSLAVEQQFYLIWPLLTLLILKLKRHYRWAIPTGLAVISVILMAFLIQGATDYTRAYQGTDSHAFGLMLGATLAFSANRPFTKQPPTAWYNRFARGFLAWGGLSIILAGFYFIPDNQPWVYPWGTLTAVAGTLLLIQGFLPTVDIAPGPGNWLATLLSLPPLRWLGERSYGIYLWHWPIWVIVVTQFPQLGTIAVAGIVCLLSVLIAALSYRYMEEPMRRDGIAATIRYWLRESADLGEPTKIAGYKGRPISLGKAILPALGMIIVLGAASGFLMIAPDKSSAQKVVEDGQNKGSKTAQPFSLQRPDTKPPTYIALPEWIDLEPIPVTGENIYVLGDSVTVASTPALEALFPGITVDGEVSRHMHQAADLLMQAEAAGKLKPYVVVALATNSPAEVGQIENILSIIGQNRRLVLVTAFGPQRIDWIPVSNQSIRTVATRYSARVKVADWSGAIVNHTDYLAGDFIHPGPQGGEIFAQTVKAALDTFPK